MPTTDRDYFARRVVQERDLAERACYPYAKRLHLELAERYSRLAGESVAEPMRVSIPA